jgi:nucleoside triphosphatase
MAKQQFPEPTVGAMIFDAKGNLFLMKTHKWGDKYAIPGGHVELGETLIDALIREVKEETNLDIHNIQFLCFQEFIYDDAFWENRHFIFFDYVCDTDSTHVILNDEAQSYIWTSLPNISSLPIEPYTMKTLQYYMKNRI